MKRIGLALLATLLLSFFAGSVPLAAQEIRERPVRLDPPDQPSVLRPTVATDGGHRFAVAWRTVGPAGQGIGAAMIDGATGVITHPEVPDPEPGLATEVSRPAVIVPQGDDFTAWIGWGELRTGGDGGCVLARPVDVSGPTLGELTLSCFPATAPPQVALAEVPGRGLAAVWTQPIGSATGPTAVFLRLFGDGGRPSARVRVWRVSPGPQIAPQVVSDAAGRLLVTWQQPWPDGTPRLLARRFGPDATPLGPAFQLETGTFFAGRPRLAGAPDGRFVAAWEEVVGDERNLIAALFNPESRVPPISYELSGILSQGIGRPDAAMDRYGLLAVAWEGIGLAGDPGKGVTAAVLDSTGHLVATLRLSGQATAGRQGNPAVSLSDTGLVLLAWESQKPGKETEVHAQLFFP